MANGLESHEGPRAVAVLSETSTRQDVVRRKHTLLVLRNPERPRPQQGQREPRADPPPGAGRMRAARPGPYKVAVGAGSDLARAAGAGEGPLPGRRAAETYLGRVHLHGDFPQGSCLTPST